MYNLNSESVNRQIAPKWNDTDLLAAPRSEAWGFGLDQGRALHGKC